MFLDRVGVQKNITKVNRTSLLEIINAPDFSSIITPKSIAVDTIMHFIRGRVNAQYSDLQAMHHLANGQIETLQFHIKEANKMTAKPLSTTQTEKRGSYCGHHSKGQDYFPNWRGYAGSWRQAPSNNLVAKTSPRFYDFDREVRDE